MGEDPLKVLSAGAVQGVVEAVAAGFQSATGRRVDLVFNTVGATRAKIEAGEAADLAIVSAPAAAALDTAGALVPGSVRMLGRVGMGLALRQGAAAPIVDSAEAFQSVLREARSVAYTDPAAGGTGGIYFATLLQRLGLTEVVGAKAVLARGGHDVAGRVARGEAEIGVTIISEIAAVPGASLGAPLPAALQTYTSYCAVLPATGTSRAAAGEFVDALRSPTAAPLWTAAGFERLA
jgi:molybdate transport system substrate-binding protein